METKKSTSAIGKRTREVLYGFRTGVELLEKMGASGKTLEEQMAEMKAEEAETVLFIRLDEGACGALDTLARFTQNDINRHQFLPALRRAGAVVEKGEYKAITESGKVKERERAEKLMAQLEAGTVFDLLDFLPSLTSRWPKELAPFREQAEQELEKIMADEDRLAAATEKLGKVPDALDVARKLKEIFDARPKLGWE